MPALDETQKLKVRLALRAQLEEQPAIDARIALLSSAQTTYLATLITKWDAVSLNTTQMVVDGVNISNPRTKAEIAGMISDCIGWNGSNNGSVLSGRGYVGDFTIGRVAQSKDPGWDYE